MSGRTAFRLLASGRACAHRSLHFRSGASTTHKRFCGPPLLSAVLMLTYSSCISQYFVYIFAPAPNAIILSLLSILLQRGKEISCQSRHIFCKYIRFWFVHLHTTCTVRDADSLFLPSCMHVYMFIIQHSMDQLGVFASPARGQPKRKTTRFPVSGRV